MKVVIAPDSYKGCISAIEVCNAIEKGLLHAGIQDIVKLPVADGGEGTIDALISATNGRRISCQVLDPLGQEIGGYFGILGDGVTAVIEMAVASGLPLVPPERRNPLITTTFGTGQLIRAAVDYGCRRILIGIGGSATNDGGVGMAQALGMRFLDAAGVELPFGGGALQQLDQIDDTALDKRYRDVELVVACDVTNPLCGPTGASHIFGPQKGATPEMVKQLDDNLLHLSQIIHRDLGIEIADLQGSGAAGGLGGGLVAFLGARLERGVSMVLDAVGIDAHLQGADLVITGEGQTDSQTAYGKVPAGVAARAKNCSVPVLCLSGGLKPGYEELFPLGITSAFSIADGPITLDDALDRAEQLLESASYSIGRLITNMKKN